jgi:hypothetical protein
MRDEPPAPSFEATIGQCQIGLRRHRRQLWALSAVGAALAVTAPLALTQLDPTDRGTDQTESADRSNGLDGMSDAQVVKACERGNQGPKATTLFFGSGTPSVRLRGSAADMSRVVLMSADSQYWAECFINHYPGAEFSAGITSVHRTTDTSKGVSYSLGFTCKDLDGPPSPPCESFVILYVDRVQDPVAAVEFTTADGATTTIRADDGFVLFTYTGKVPDEYSKTELRRQDPFLIRITYLGQDNTPLAAQDMRTSDSDRMKVGDLPLLEAYPSQRTDGIGIDFVGRPPQPH